MPQDRLELAKMRASKYPVLGNKGNLWMLNLFFRRHMQTTGRGGQARSAKVIKKTGDFWEAFLIAVSADFEYLDEFVEVSYLMEAATLFGRLQHIVDLGSVLPENGEESEDPWLLLWLITSWPFDPVQPGALELLLVQCGT